MITPIDPALYKELLDLVSDGVYFVVYDRRIVYWNKGARRLTGYSAKGMVGKHCQDDLLCHVDPTEHNLCKDGCPLAVSLEDAQARNASVFLRHKEGRRVPVSIRVQPIRGADGAIEVFSDDYANWDARRRPSPSWSIIIMETPSPSTGEKARPLRQMASDSVQVGGGALFSCMPHHGCEGMRASLACGYYFFEHHVISTMHIHLGLFE